jgi:Sec-independent protein translocase protein TatA
VLEVIALIGVIVIVALVVFAANRLKRIGGK